MPLEAVNDFVIRFANVNGSGSASANEMFARAIMRMGEGERESIGAISTGSLSLDMCLGIGGLPRGRITEIYGPESGGKTTLALHCVAEAQKLGGLALYIDAEHAMELAMVRGVMTEHIMHAVSQEMFGGDDAEHQRGDSMEDLLAVLADYFAYFTKLTASRREHPTEHRRRTRPHQQPVADVRALLGADRTLVTAVAGAPVDRSDAVGDASHEVAVIEQFAR